MRALLDVNVLLALMDRDHIHHQPALAWWRSNRDDGWASCPLTQNAFVRISCQRIYPNRPTAVQAIDQLRRQLAEPSYVFWSDDISIADDGVFDRGRILGPNQITDAYLLALAM
jgi:toxin-antitoxin system PIN domain toxin